MPRFKVADETESFPGLGRDEARFMYQAMKQTLAHADLVEGNEKEFEGYVQVNQFRFNVLS